MNYKFINRRTLNAVAAAKLFGVELSVSRQLKLEEGKPVIITSDTGYNDQLLFCNANYLFKHQGKPTPRPEDFHDRVILLPEVGVIGRPSEMVVCDDVHVWYDFKMMRHFRQNQFALGWQRGTLVVPEISNMTTGKNPGALFDKTYPEQTAFYLLAVTKNEAGKHELLVGVKYNL